MTYNIYLIKGEEKKGKKEEEKIINL